MPRLFKINLSLVSISSEAEILLKFMWKATLEDFFFFLNCCSFMHRFFFLKEIGFVAKTSHENCCTVKPC